jgi:ABC-type polysaccharide/polyol phosphate transport system ATPase subunit
VSALGGMSRMFASGARPALVFECNGGTLPLFGASICRLRAAIADLGYELFLIDHLRPGVLVEASADGVQTECVSDYLAVVSRPGGLAERWLIEPPLGIEQTVTRVLDQAASTSSGYRRYAAGLLADGPAWLRDDPLAAPGRRALELDVSPAVRAAFDRRRAPSAAVEHVDAAEPGAIGRPAGVAVLVEDVGLRAPSSGPERLLGDVRPDELVLRDASFHVRGGQLLGILADNPLVVSELLKAIAGFVRPVTGRLEVGGHAALLSAIGEVLEDHLSIRDNIAVLAAFFGGHVPDVGRRVADVAQAAGLHGDLDSTLRDAGAVTAVRLALAVAFEFADPRVLLLGELPVVDDPSFRDWVRGCAQRLCGSGAAIVQAVADPSQLVAPADRMLWIRGGEVLACGHAGSVADAFLRERLGLTDARGRARRRAMSGTRR